MTTKADAKAKAKKKARPPAPLPAGCEALLSKAQLCAALGVSLRTLQGMLSAGEFPRADLRLGALPRWKVNTLNAWIERRSKKKGG